MTLFIFHFFFFQMVATELKEKIDSLTDLITLPWLLNKKFSHFKESLVMLVNGLSKYYSFMTVMKQRTADNNRKEEPVRSLDDSWSITIFEGEKNQATKPEYAALNRAVNDLEYYTPLDLCNFEPYDKEDRRKWLNGIQLSASVCLFIDMEII